MKSLICSTCGADETSHETPNLFKFATSELSQDAFLCWLFEHARVQSGDIAYSVAKHFLDHILDQFRAIRSTVNPADLSSYSVRNIEQQVHHIDILLTLESSIRTEKIYIIIEDKIHSGESRDNQPEYYARKLKIRDSEAVIIPVLFKTGFAAKEEREDFEDRNIIFIGNKEIYETFSAYSDRLQDNVILNSWWIHFHKSYYAPIEQAKSHSIDPDMTLEQYNHVVKDNKFPEVIAFNKISDYLFHPIAESFTKKIYSVQGHGHVDWHLELSRANWKSTEKNIAISVYFIWDTYNFSLVVKTSPYPYKSLKKLTEDEKKVYMAARDAIKSDFRTNKHTDWRITNYYLQIAQLKNIHTMALEHLKKKVHHEIGQISDEIDRIVGETSKKV